MPLHDWTRVNDGTFHDFHHEWISAIKRALNGGLLPSDYYAMAEQIAGGLHPDLLTLEKKGGADEANGTAWSPPGNGGLAVATAPPKVWLTATAETESYARKRKTIAVRHVSGDRVVALVEIVSPGNKNTRHGLRAFVDKAVEFLEAGIHLLILDLHPPGSRDPQGIHGAIWSEVADDSFRLPPGKNRTLVSYEAHNQRRAYVTPVAVGEPLPEMPLFLEPEVYVNVPLDATYRAAFDGLAKRWRDVLEALPPSPSPR